MPRSTRITGLAASSCSFPPRSSVQSTGTSVTARMVAASTANVFVKASGWNSLPAWPVSANTGMNASTMIAIEKNTGRPTSRVDSSTARHTARRSRTSMPLPLDLAERVLGDDDARVDQHADGDGDARQAHDVRRDARVVHAEERDQHRERQRQRDDEDRAEVHQEHDVRERHQRDLLEQRRAQRVHRLRDQRRAVVERHDA